MRDTGCEIQALWGHVMPMVIVILCIVKSKHPISLAHPISRIPYPVSRSPNLFFLLLWRADTIR